jgi:geranylgeranyl diphosphate synthase type II
MQTVNSSSQNFDFTAYCNQRRKLVENRLSEYLTDKPPVKLWESMRYSVLSGGKRLRAILCLASAEAVNNNYENPIEDCLPCSCALEMVHAMSLIHDDLPSMDNDDFRRGQPTNHKVYGEAMALLAGDALLMLAIEILVKHTPTKVDRDLLLQIVTGLCQATGASGMVGGQVLDLAFTGDHNNSILDSRDNISNQSEAVEAIHNGKTAALIKFAVWSGAKIALATDSQLDTLDQFAQNLGLAFQITDDILDSTGDLHTLGKTPGKDQAANKTTWVTIFGAAKAQEKLNMLEKDGLAILDGSSLDKARTQPLKELLKYAIHRQK